MRLVLDVNLPPFLATALTTSGVDAIHWTEIGDAKAPDDEILSWATSNGCVIVTQDLDFPELLAKSRASLPSVLLLRNADVLARSLSSLLRSACEQCQDALEAGAIVVLDARGLRVRTLPIED